MRAAIGFEREVNAIVNSIQSLRHHLTPGHFRPHIKVVPDQFNNVNRRCTISGKGNKREWQIIVPMQDQEYYRYYLVKNIFTDERLIVSDRVVGNLY